MSKLVQEDPSVHADVTRSSITATIFLRPQQPYFVPRALFPITLVAETD